MGSIISLGVEKLELDWGKNHSFKDHSTLFQKKDRTEIEYFYAEGNTDRKPGFSRALRRVLPRLKLLGYSGENLAKIYRESCEKMPDYYPDVEISFDQFRGAIRSIDLDRIAIDEDSEYYDLGEFAVAILKNPEVRKYLPRNLLIDRDVGTFFENLDPYLTLSILGENPRNLDRFVQWRYSDVVEGGWVAEEEVFHPISDEEKILIITEGSSDSFVLQKAFKYLQPDVSDFFRFLDMEDTYPFTGTGNLVRFCQGLSSIKISNDVLVILDNDTSG